MLEMTVTYPREDMPQLALYLFGGMHKRTYGKVARRRANAVLAVLTVVLVAMVAAGVLWTRMARAGTIIRVAWWVVVALYAWQVLRRWQLQGRYWQTIRSYQNSDLVKNSYHLTVNDEGVRSVRASGEKEVFVAWAQLDRMLDTPQYYVLIEDKQVWFLLPKSLPDDQRAQLEDLLRRHMQDVPGKKILRENTAPA